MWQEKWYSDIPILHFHCLWLYTLDLDDIPLLNSLELIGQQHPHWLNHHRQSSRCFPAKRHEPREIRAAQLGGDVAEAPGVHISAFEPSSGWGFVSEIWFEHSWKSILLLKSWKFEVQYTVEGTAQQEGQEGNGIKAKLTRVAENSEEVELTRSTLVRHFSTLIFCYAINCKMY